jgi:hypothetical protein
VPEEVVQLEFGYSDRMSSDFEVEQLSPQMPAVEQMFAPSSAPPSSAPPPLSPPPSLVELPLACAELVEVEQVEEVDSWMPPMSWLPEVEELMTLPEVEELVEEVEVVEFKIRLQKNNCAYSARADRLIQEVCLILTGGVGNCSCTGRNQVGPESVRCKCSLRDDFREGCCMHPTELDHSPRAFPPSPHPDSDP